MEEFLGETPDVFGDLWHLLCELRGVKNTQKGSKRDRFEAARKSDKIHSVFFELLAMAQNANRHSLSHWALITGKLGHKRRQSVLFYIPRNVQVHMNVSLLEFCRGRPLLMARFVPPNMCELGEGF